MAGANPQRTSRVNHQVDGQLTIIWYRPIEAYIPQHFQIIAVNNILYISTGKGLYALDANNGDTVWRFDTELPLGNSPTVFEGRVYVGGHDKRLYVLDASNGRLLWSFDQAQAGYSTNPIVIRDSYTNNQPVILIGNRDGNFYAIGAHGHPMQGQVLWKYTIPNKSPILTSAAYKDGIVYTTAMDNRLYALVVNTNNPQGQLRWVTNQFQGDVFLAYWPVIYRDKIILVKSSDVVDDWRPGSRSLSNPSSTSFSDYWAAEASDLSNINPRNVAEIGNILDPVSWSGGYRVTDARYALEYLEEPTSTERSSDPTGSNRYNHKPWRRQYYVINQNDGSEFTFDSDSDGLREYLPVLAWRAESGPMYPPVIGANGIAYFTAKFNRGQIMGWNIDQPNYLSFTSTSSYALDEPLSVSMGGDRIYTSLCCDRPATSFLITSGSREINYWGGYMLNTNGKANGYDEMWYIFDVAIDRHQGTYVGAKDWYGIADDGIKTTNAVFNSHGVQNPLIPHNGKLFIHRSNAIIALGTGTEQGKKQYLPINEVSTQVSTPDLNNLLENEINKMINAGHLKAGYYVQNQFHTAQNGQLPNYFMFPGDTLLVLSQTYPHLSSQTKQNLARYLREEWSMYFYPTAYATRGFDEGEKRQQIPLPPEIENDFMNIRKSTSISGHSWQYPQHSIYAMWKYAQNVPEGERPSISEIYSVARSKVQVPATSDSVVMRRKPFEINSWIAGYIGFLELYRLAGSPQQDATLASRVQAELDRLLNWRTQQFTKESWAFPSYNIQHKLDTSRNFIWLTPELANHMVNTIPDKVNLALDEYLYLNQYWFVNRFENDMGESSTQHLYNYHALFLANAYILKKPRQELIKYLDVPAFERGDLFYIQNLVVALEASSSGGITTTTRTTTTTAPITTTRTLITTTPTTTTRTTTPLTTTTTLNCIISNPVIVSNCGGCCREGQTVTMLANINNMQACSAATTFQIDAEGSGCIIEFTGGSMSGITSSPQLSTASISGTWTIPRVPASCQGRTVYASYAALWQGNPGSGTRISLSSASQGSLT
ncbi:MAG: PQQ-binding-like beta-propeller repeat protein, partial [Candidatus Aenigmarchaeota archaeon]|nr:PQQ-binding-like beta-propeller repeat protein [Candidatus Aenigmarchaeota archaeon]